MNIYVQPVLQPHVGHALVICCVPVGTLHCEIPRTDGSPVCMRRMFNKEQTIILYFFVLFFHLQTSCWFLSWFTLWHWWRRQYIPPKCQWKSTGLHAITYEMTELFTGSVCHLNLASSLLGLLSDHGGWRQYTRPKCWWTSTRLHSITSQKEEVFIPQKKVPIKIYFACILQGNPESYQGGQLLVCQATCNYSLKTTLWSARLLKVSSTYNYRIVQSSY